MASQIPALAVVRFRAGTSRGTGPTRASRRPFPPYDMSWTGRKKCPTPITETPAISSRSRAAESVAETPAAPLSKLPASSGSGRQCVRRFAVVLGVSVRRRRQLAYPVRIRGAAAPKPVLSRNPRQDRAAGNEPSRTVNADLARRIEVVGRSRHYGVKRSRASRSAASAGSGAAGICRGR